MISKRKVLYLYFLYKIRICIFYSNHKLTVSNQVVVPIVWASSGTGSQSCISTDHNSSPEYDSSLMQLSSDGSVREDTHENYQYGNSTISQHQNVLPDYGYYDNQLSLER